jgi:hypothetical protein
LDESGDGCEPSGRTGTGDDCDGCGAELDAPVSAVVLTGEGEGELMIWKDGLLLGCRMTAIVAPATAPALSRPVRINAGDFMGIYTFP